METEPLNSSEEIEDNEISWLTASDVLFTNDHSFWDTANVSYKDITALYGYIEGYRHSADNLVNQVLESEPAYSTHKDFLVYPIVFLYRQYIELSLKRLIIYGKWLSAQSVKKPSSLPKTHDLVQLWQKCRPLIINFYNEENNEVEDKLLIAMDSLINEFHQIDRDSSAFRYHVTTTQTPSLPNRTLINLRHFKNTMTKIINYLEDVYNVFAYQEKKLHILPAIANFGRWIVTRKGLEGDGFQILKEDVYEKDWIAYHRGRVDLKSLTFALRFTQTIWDKNGKCLRPQLLETATHYWKIPVFDTNLLLPNRPQLNPLSQTKKLGLALAYRAIGENVAQWIVTVDGLESLDENHPFQVSLAELHQHDWAFYMAFEEWVDLDNFVELLEYAKKIWDEQNICLRPDLIATAKPYSELLEIVEKRKLAETITQSKPGFKRSGIQNSTSIITSLDTE